MLSYVYNVNILKSLRMFSQYVIYSSRHALCAHRNRHDLLEFCTLIFCQWIFPYKTHQSCAFCEDRSYLDLSCHIPKLFFLPKRIYLQNILHFFSFSLFWQMHAKTQVDIPRSFYTYSQISYCEWLCSYHLSLKETINTYTWSILYYKSQYCILGHEAEVQAL